MHFLHSKAEEGYDIEENRLLFSGIDRYRRAARKVENDHFRYLDDLQRSEKVVLDLPSTGAPGSRRVDGLIVRNPTSFLLKEWARRDRTNSSLGRGFSFLATSFGGQRFILGVDPARGVNLRGLGGLLNLREEQERRKAGRDFLSPWYEGNCPFFNYRIIDSPKDGTVLRPEDVLDCLMVFSRQHAE